MPTKYFSQFQNSNSYAVKCTCKQISLASKRKKKKKLPTLQPGGCVGFRFLCEIMWHVFQIKVMLFIYFKKFASWWILIATMTSSIINNNLSTPKASPLLFYSVKLSTELFARLFDHCCIAISSFIRFIIIWFLSKGILKGESLGKL